MTAVNLRCQLTAETQETRVNGHYVGGASLWLTTGHWTVGFPPLCLCALYQNLEATAVGSRPTHAGAL
jgi:hypothetical protein